MRIKEDCIVSIDYTLRNAAGVLLGANGDGEPFSYLHGHHQIVSGLEEALVGKAKDDVISVTVPPESGYGRWNPQRVFSVPLDGLPDGLEVKPGVRFQQRLPDGATGVVAIREVHTESVTVDANHVLAGATLYFDVTVCGVRHATEQELMNAQREEAAERAGS